MEKKPVSLSVATRSEDIERLYDAHEVAAQYKVSEKSLHKWARQGVIPAVSLAGCGVFGRAPSTNIWIRKRPVEPSFLTGTGLSHHLG